MHVVDICNRDELQREVFDYLGALQSDECKRIWEGTMKNWMRHIALAKE